MYDLMKELGICRKARQNALSTTVDSSIAEAMDTSETVDSLRDEATTLTHPAHSQEFEDIEMPSFVVNCFIITVCVCMSFKLQYIHIQVPSPPHSPRQHDTTLVTSSPKTPQNRYGRSISLDLSPLPVATASVCLMQTAYDIKLILYTHACRS